MERKGGSTTVAVTAHEVRSTLARARVSSAEEKALRMRHGATVTDLKAPLPNVAEGNDELGDELLLIQMQLLRSYRAHLAKKAAAPRVAQPRNLAKERIVRGLRKKN